MSLAPLDNQWTRQLSDFGGCEVKMVNDETIAIGQVGIFLSSIHCHRRNLLREVARSKGESSTAEAAQQRPKEKAEGGEER